MVLQVNSVSKIFTTADKEDITVLKNIKFSVEKGSSVALVGHSGSGKSTLLSLLGGLDRPTNGSITVNGNALNDMNENGLAKFRAHNIGIVFQQFHLMPHLTALENISLPLEIIRQKNIREPSLEALRLVGLSERASHLPTKLSGGESQRIAIARALVNKPSVLLADEPTGNLDQASSDITTQLMFDLVKKHGTTLLLATHNLELAERCDYQLQLKGGVLQ